MFGSMKRILNAFAASTQTVKSFSQKPTLLRQHNLLFSLKMLRNKFNWSKFSFLSHDLFHKIYFNRIYMGLLELIQWFSWVLVVLYEIKNRTSSPLILKGPFETGFNSPKMIRFLKKHGFSYLISNTDCIKLKIKICVKILKYL